MTKPDKNGWLPIANFTEYAISRDGLVRLKCGRVTAGYVNDKGYRCVTLRKPGLRRVIPVHRLVALAFLDPAHTDETVNHKNGCKFDNRVENLEWATREENTRHAIENGLGPYSPPRLFGIHHPKHKLTDDIVEEAYLCVVSGHPFRAVARRLGVDRKSLRRRFSNALNFPVTP